MSGIFTVNPIGMTAKEWTAASHINLERFGAIPALQRNEDWQNWGAAISLLSSLGGMVIPNPYEFTDFQTWAERFNESIAGIV